MSHRKTLAVVGHGMVGHRFCQRLVERGGTTAWRVVIFGEEPRAAYDRVGLTQFFAHRDPERLMLAKLDWYREQGIELHVGDRVETIDCDRRTLRSTRGVELAWDAIVLATGSTPFVPPVPGTGKNGVFLYRTIEDLEQIVAYGARVRSAAVIGGGLLGLEAAKAAHDLGLETHVVEFAPRLMPRQVDESGSRLLVREIERLGVTVHLSKSTREILGNGSVTGLSFADGGEIPVGMVIVSCGIRPRDDLARAAGLAVGERGGVVVDDHLRTSDPGVYAIGEVALHAGTVYGLVAPGYQMAETVADNLTGADRSFAGGDLSAKLKLMGVDVASFGEHEAGPARAEAVTYEDPFRGVYRKLFVTPDGARLLGGVLVGDAGDYSLLASLAKAGGALPVPPGDLVRGSSGGSAPPGVDLLGDDAAVCSCHDVSKGALRVAIRDEGCASVADLKRCTRAGTGCGGCVPLVTDLFRAEMKALGKAVTNHLCEHFPMTRQELFAVVNLRRYRTFPEVVGGCGSGNGCEVCKPAVASILASLWNESVLDHSTIQDTNDRFLANMQRGGLYSVVPRVPGGEITPEKLVVLGNVARKYGLYTKITGGQRIDLFGAEVHQLPDIWEELVEAGFESGHAYGKAMRTVKSCVGTTWCRFGVQDSVGFAIRVENRYRGLRAPHKLKSAVSGCVRECAEAQSKDFGLIATEKGWNLYVCGNGGAKPRHADLLASDVDEDTAIRLIDRFLMYYVETADKLTRTSVWLENLEGGIERLREIVVEDALGIGEELERRMQHLVDTYRCEWTEVVRNPERRQWFRQFVNGEETEPGIELVDERGQKRPADWPRELPPLAGEHFNGDGLRDPDREWVRIGSVTDFPADGGRTILHGKTQIAVFRFESRGEWYATQNLCPHKRALVLSRGILGDSGGVPKVACPLHKKTFGLRDGKCLGGEPLEISTFPVKVEEGSVFLFLPPVERLDGSLATPRVRIRASDASPTA